MNIARRGEKRARYSKVSLQTSFWKDDRRIRVNEKKSNGVLKAAGYANVSQQQQRCFHELVPPLVNFAARNRYAKFATFLPPCTRSPTIARQNPISHESNESEKKLKTKKKKREKKRKKNCKRHADVRTTALFETEKLHCSHTP